MPTADPTLTPPLDDIQSFALWCAGWCGECGDDRSLHRRDECDRTLYDAFLALATERDSLAERLREVERDRERLVRKAFDAGKTYALADEMGNLFWDAEEDIQRILTGDSAREREGS